MLTRSESPLFQTSLLSLWWIVITFPFGPNNGDRIMHGIQYHHVLSVYLPFGRRRPWPVGGLEHYPSAILTRAQLGLGWLASMIVWLQWVSSRCGHWTPWCRGQTCPMAVGPEMLRFQWVLSFSFTPSWTLDGGRGRWSNRTIHVFCHVLTLIWSRCQILK